MLKFQWRIKNLSEIFLNKLELLWKHKMPIKNFNATFDSWNMINYLIIIQAKPFQLFAGIELLIADEIEKWNEQKSWTFSNSYCFEGKFIILFMLRWMIFFWFRLFEFLFYIFRKIFNNSLRFAVFHIRYYILVFDVMKKRFVESIQSLHKLNSAICN